MKKLFYLFIAFAVIGFTSCSKDEETAPTEETPDETSTTITFDDISGSYSQASVEANKATIEDEGVKLVGEIEALEDEPAIEATANMASMMEGEDESSPAKGSIPNKFQGLIDVIANGGSPMDIMSEMKSKGEEDDIEAEWNDMKATYTWNFTSEEFDSTGNSTGLKIVFPSTETGTTNNATAEVTGVTFESVNPMGEADEAETVPTALTATLTVDGATALSYTFSASFNSEDIPSAVATKLTIGAFVFDVSVTNTTTAATAAYSFMNGTTTIMAFNAAAAGNWAESNIDANTTTEVEYDEYGYEDPVTGDYIVEWVDTNEYDEVNIDQILSSANASFQLMGLKVVGKIDVAGMYTGIYPIMEDDEDPTQADMQSVVDIMNSKAQLYLAKASSNEVIASAEAYVTEYTDEECDWEYDDVLGYDQWVCEEVTGYEPDLRLKFGDSSVADVESYIEDGFSDLISELNDFITSLNTDYDMDMELLDDPAMSK